MSASYRPPPSVAFRPELSWILKESVLVKWQDKCTREELHLGQSTPTNEEVPLSLWVGRGHSEGQDVLVVMLQLNVCHYVSSRKKRKTMFLLPSSDLRIDGHEDFSPIALHDLDSSVRHQIHQLCPDIPEQKRFVRLTVKSTSSQVVMPMRSDIASASTSHTKQMHGTALHLVLLLKSLSEAASFNVYMHYSSYAVTGLNSALSALQRGHTLPALDLPRMYNSNGGACKAWEQYLDLKEIARDSEHVPNPRHPKRKRRRDHSPDLREDIPPPYVEKPRAGQSADLFDPNVSGLIEIIVPESVHAYTPRELSNDAIGDVIPETPLGVQQPASPVSYSGVVCDAPATLGATLPAQSQELTAFEGVVQVAQIQHPARPLISERAARGQESLPGSPVNHSHPERATQSPLPVEHVAQALQSPVLPVLPVLQPRAPYCLPHLPLASDYKPIRCKDDVSNTLNASLTNWIYSMRKIHLHMHEIPEIFTLLIAFGPAVEHGDVRRFVYLKARCTTIVLRESTAIKSASGSLALTVAETPERRVQDMIRWLYGCVLDIETIMMDDLKELSQRAVAWTRRLQAEQPQDKQLNHSVGSEKHPQCTIGDAFTIEEEIDDTEAAYLFYEATCIAKLCVLFGHILRHL